MTWILLVEDDPGIARHLGQLLAAEGYEVAQAASRQAALDELAARRFDLLLVDVSLPDGSGYAVCTAAKRLSDAAVVFLTASDDEASVVTGLELGADDYITKPFRPLELLSRLKAVLRRGGQGQMLLQAQGVTVDTVRGTVHKGAAEVFLSALEYRLLLAFMNNPSAVLTRDRLQDEVWSVAGEFVNDNTLTVYVKRLREKLEDDPQNPTLITTVRGLGYRLEA